MGDASSAGSCGRAFLWLKPLLLLTGASLALGFLYAIDPSRSAAIPPCLFNKLTGLSCPGCGSMRALHAALHGDLLSALDFNALAVLLIPFLIYSAGRMVSPASVRPDCWRPLSAAFERAYSSRVVLVAVLSFWVLRNVPWNPFARLAP